jgi:TRAP transporter TAXI family solute receptor
LNGSGTGRRAAEEAGSSVAKAVEILRCFAGDQEQWGIRELAATLGHPVSTVHRLLQILRRERMLDFDPASRKYRVGVELTRISAVLSRRLKVRELARPLMEELVARFNESCWLAIHDAQDEAVVYVDEVESSQPLRHHAPIGRRERLDQTAAGQVVASLLTGGRPSRGFRQMPDATESVSRHGYAVSTLLEWESASMIAAPILDSQNAPIGSLCLVVPAHRRTDAGEAAMGAAVAAGARKLSRILGSTLMGGGGAGTWHAGIQVIADIVHRDLPEVALTPLGGAGDAALASVGGGKAAYCLAVEGSLRAAWEGLSPFRRRHVRLRAMFRMAPLLLQIVARPGVAVDGLRDLAGLRVSPGEKGYCTAFVYERLMRLAGIGPAAITRQGGTVAYLNYAEANRQLRAGLLDAVMSLSGTPNPAYVEIDRELRLQVVPIDDVLLTRFAQAHPGFVAGDIAAGSYRSQRRPIRTVTSSSILVAGAQRSADEVQRVARAIVERRDEIAQLVPSYRQFDVDSAIDALPIPLHDGAADFWRSFHGAGR